MHMRKAFENIKHITLRETRYRIVLCSRLGSDDNPVYGECSDPNSKSPMIRYHVCLKGMRRLDVLIHEMLHACFWDIDEEGIEESASDIARALWRLGWKLDHEEGCKKPKLKYFSFREKRYKYERVSGLKKGDMGSVTSPLLKNKVLQVRISLKGEKELFQHIKYMLYACFWDFDREAVEETAEDIARELIRIGYSKT